MGVFRLLGRFKKKKLWEFPPLFDLTFPALNQKKDKKKAIRAFEAFFGNFFSLKTPVNQLRISKKMP
jgi:hypothetical protein